jgi:hypothetical protein
MAVEIVEGILVPAQPQRLKRGYGIFRNLQINAADGQVRTFDKVATGEPITSEVTKGGAGRFYFVKSDGALGLIGVQRPDGSRLYGYFSNFAPLLIVIGALASIGTVARFGFGVDFPLTASVLGPLLLIAGIYLGQQKAAARSAFEADRG